MKINTFSYTQEAYLMGLAHTIQYKEIEYAQLSAILHGPTTKEMQFHYQDTQGTEHRLNSMKKCLKILRTAHS